MKTTELHTTMFPSLPELETHTKAVPPATYPPAGLITLSCSLGSLNRTPVATLMKVLRKTITERLRVKLSAGGWFLILLGLSVVSTTVYAGHSLSDHEQNNLLQFTAGGHVLGFKSNQMYLATGSHALSTEFVGTAGVTPQTTEVSETSSKTLPLTKVTYPSLWKGITLVYEQTPGGVVKSTYTVAPFAKVNNIKLRYNVPVKVTTDGGLRFDFETGYLNESPPVAWQDIGEKKVPVSVAFQQTEKNEAGFITNSYDPSYPLIIDPAITWNTFMGSNAVSEAIAVDGSGNVYVAGNSAAPSWGSPVNTHSGSLDGFVTKLNSSGVRQWNTFMGGTLIDGAFAIAVDGGGNVYVTGRSTTTWGSPVNAFAGGTDAFAAKLNSNGGRQWNTFMGSSSADYGYGIAVDGSGNVYVTGRSTATWGSPVNAFAGGTADAFVAKLDSNGARLWNTFMGSSASGSDSECGAIAVDGSENVYVAGYSNATWGSPVNAYTTGPNAFAAKLNNSGTLLWNTFMGGGGTTGQGYGIAVDGSGNVYVEGPSNATWGSPVNAFAGGTDVFAAKLNNSGTLLWNTFMGGTGNDNLGLGLAIAVAGNGNVYVTGYSPATWGSPVQAYSGGGTDAFVAKLNSSGGRQWNTFIGGTGGDNGSAIAVDGSGNVYVAGYSYATWGSPVNAFAGSSDAFAVKISNNPPVASNGSFTTPANTALSNLLTATDIDADPLTYSIVVNGTIGTATITNASTGAFTYVPNANQTGTDTFTFKVNDGFVDSNIATITITILISAPIANNGSFITPENTALSNLLTATDVDGEPLTYSIVANGTLGTATITNASTGAFTYTPNANQTGTDTFTFKVNDGLVDSNIATITITITSATPPPPLPDQLGLFLQLDGTGKGKVTSDTGLSCQSSDCQKQSDGSLTCNPQTCSQIVKTATTVVLTPIPDTGSIFSNWGGNEDCMDGQLLMNGGKLCLAYFHLIAEPLTVVMAGQGTVTATNLNCPRTCVVYYPYGSAVTLQTQPAAGWQFQAFSGDCDSNGQVLLIDTKNCGVTFMPNPATFDEDLDQVPSAIEEAAPNQGDGNGDGIPDTQQNNVASFVDVVSGLYLTLQTDLSCPITNVYGELPDKYPGHNPNHHLPQGLTYFELSCAQTQVSLYSHAMTAVRRNLIFQKFGQQVPGDEQTVGWYRFPNVTFEAVMIGGKSVVKATYLLTDGELGDSTGVDGKIVDPAGLGLK